MELHGMVSKTLWMVPFYNCNGSSVEGLIEHDCAYVAWINRLLDPFPILPLENCSSGGQRMDYTMLATHPL